MTAARLPAVVTAEVLCWGSLRAELYEVPRRCGQSSRLVKFFPGLMGGVWECDKRCPATPGTCYHIALARECRAAGCMPIQVRTEGAGE